MTFLVIPVAGKYAGEEIETGVDIDELAAWPISPPHWIHFLDRIQLSKTNSKPSPIDGWLKHSRDIQRWGNAMDPTQAWLAHVRSVLEES